MTPEELQTLIDIGQETRSLEFKSAGAWTNLPLRAQVIRTAIAMANTKDGGTLVIGMAPDPARPGYHLPQPLTPEQRATFTPDEVIPVINAFSTPHLDLRVQEHGLSDGNSLVVLSVAQFRDFPVLCTRPIVSDGNKVLVQEGRVLIRSRRTSETTEVRSPDDFRELVELAVDRGLETYFRRRTIESAVAGPDDDALFRAELGPLVA